MKITSTLLFVLGMTGAATVHAAKSHSDEINVQLTLNNILQHNIAELTVNDVSKTSNQLLAEAKIPTPPKKSVAGRSYKSGQAARLAD